MADVYHRWSTSSIVLSLLSVPSTARTALRPLGQGRLDDAAPPSSRRTGHFLIKALDRWRTSSSGSRSRIALCLHSALAQITQQLTARHGVFGGSFSHSQHVFVALLIDSYCDQKDMLCHMNSVEHQHTELEGIKPTLKEFLDLRSRLDAFGTSKSAVNRRFVKQT